MKKFVCSVCGYVHSAEELAADFKCPVCRVPASKFVEQKGEMKLAAFNMAAGGFLHRLIQCLGHLNLVHIHHRITAGADEMHMGVHIGIEPLDTTDGCHTLDDSLTAEPGQIPVDRGKGDIRVVFLKHLVYHIRRGVSIGTAKTLQDGIALFKLL